MNEELRCASEFSAQVFALRSNARGAGIQMALPRHIATQCNQAGSAKAEFIGSQQRSDHDVAPSLQATIDAYSYAPAQPIAYERLLRLCQPALPGDTGVLDRLKRRGARPTIMPADLDIISVRFCHTSGDRANANASRGDLLDFATDRVAIERLMIPVRVLATFAGIVTSTDAVHSGSDGAVRFRAQRAKGHCGV